MVGLFTASLCLACASFSEFVVLQSIFQFVRLYVCRVVSSHICTEVVVVSQNVLQCL